LEYACGHTWFCLFSSLLQWSSFCRLGLPGDQGICAFCSFDLCIRQCADAVQVQAHLYALQGALHSVADKYHAILVRRLRGALHLINVYCVCNSHHGQLRNPWPSGMPKHTLVDSHSRSQKSSGAGVLIQVICTTGTRAIEEAASLFSAVMRHATCPLQAKAGGRDGPPALHRAGGVSTPYLYRPSNRVTTAFIKRVGCPQ